MQDVTLKFRQRLNFVALTIKHASKRPNNSNQPRNFLFKHLEREGRIKKGKFRIGERYLWGDRSLTQKFDI